MDEAEGAQEHRPFEDMAVAHVLGGLDGDQGRVFRSHLLECSECRARVGELRAIASDLAGVERDERRERTTRAVETKRRAEAEDGDASVPDGPRPAPRWLVLLLMTLLVALAAYTFVLRANNNRLEQALDDRMDASAAMEHGEDLSIEYRAAGVTATAKAHGNRLVLLVEGLEPDTGYGVYLLDDQPESPQTVYRHPLVPRDGKVFVLLPLRGAEDRLMVTAPERAMALEPDGQRVLEVLVPEMEPVGDSIGSA